jgi:hypothetical protein
MKAHLKNLMIKWINLITIKSKKILLSWCTINIIKIYQNFPALEEEIETRKDTNWVSFIKKTEINNLHNSHWELNQWEDHRLRIERSYCKQLSHPNLLLSRLILMEWHVSDLIFLSIKSNQEPSHNKKNKTWINLMMINSKITAYLASHYTHHPIIRQAKTLNL